MAKKYKSGAEALAARAQEIAGQPLVPGKYGAPAGSPFFGPDYGRYDPAREAARQAPAPEPASGDFLAGWDYQSAERGPSGDELPAGAAGWKPDGTPYFGEGLTGWWKETVSRFNAPAKPGAVGVPGGLSAEKLAQIKATLPGKLAANPPQSSTAGKVIGAGVNIGLSAIGEPAKKVEQSIGMRGVQGEIGAASPLPQIKEMPSWLQFLLDSNPVWKAAYQDVLTLTSPKLKEQFTAEVGQVLHGGLPFIKPGSELDKGYQAGRIAYTGVVNPLAVEDFKRRFMAGEHPALLAQELENPAAEFAGQLVLDPLNFIGAPAKATRLERRIGSAYDEFIRAAPEVGRVLQTVGDAANDTRAAGGLDEMAQAVGSVIERVKTGKAELAAQGRDYSLFALTSSGKQYVTARQMGEIVQFVGANDPAMLADTVRAMYLIGGENADEIAESIAIARKLKAPTVLYSDAGVQSAVVMRRMAGDNPDAFLKALKEAQAGGVEGVLELVTSKTDEAVKGLFPTIAERVAAGEAVPPALQSLARLDTALQKNLYKPVNSVFAGVYMGLSPGYAIRNFITNTTQALIDEGPGVLRHGPAAWIDRTKGWLGGALPKGVAGFSKGTVGVDVSVKAAGLPGTKLAAKFEEGASAQVVGKVVQDTMLRMLRPGRAIPDIAPLIDAGLPAQAAERLWREVVVQKGDAASALELVRSEMKLGGVDLFRGGSWLAEGDIKALADFGLLDLTHTAAGRATTVEEFLATVRSGFDNLAAEGRQVAGDVPVVNENAIGVEAVQNLGEALARGDVDESTVRLASHFTEANHQAFYAYQDAIGQLYRENPLDPNWASLRGLLTPDAGAVRAVQEERRSTAWAITNLSKQQGFDLGAAWRRLGLQGAPPQGMTPQAFRDKLWSEYYWDYIRGRWNTARDEYAGAVEQAFQVIPTADDRKLKQARTALDYAKQWDGVAQDNNLTRALEAARQRGDTAGAVRVLANKYGIASATAEGVPLDNSILLSTINKYLPEGTEPYKALADVPEKVAEGAFTQRLAEKAGLMAPKTTATVVDRMAETAADSTPLMDEVGWEAANNAINLKLDEWAKLPKAKMPGKVANALDEEAGKMLAQMEIAEPGKRLFDENGFAGSYPSSFPDWYREYGGAKTSISKALERILAGGSLDEGAQVQAMKRFILNRIQATDARVMMELGQEHGAWKALTKELDEGVDIYQKYGYYGEDAFELLGRDPAELADRLPSRPAPPLPPYAGNTPMRARVIQESQAGLEGLYTRLETAAREAWGKAVPTDYNRTLDTALTQWGDDASRRVAEARLISANVADAARDFTLLSYPQKRYIDLALAYVYPYQFWYRGTYGNWMKRIATSPEVIAGYAKYKDYLSRVHAGAPEWWRYSINTNELLGLDSDNPLFFNLESALNPLNGLTGVNFEDPDKREGWFATMLDGLNRFGPSTWTPFSLATAAVMMAKGDEEAAAKWGGRLVPQTATLKSALALMNVKTHFLGAKGVNEFDPAVLFFAGGQDPYERRRAGRALAVMSDLGQITPEEALDAARSQSGPLWDEALLFDQRQRAGGQLTGFALGVGYKQRNLADIAIDHFDQERAVLMAMRTDLAPDEYRDRWDALKARYPFAETVLLSRKGGEERDGAYAYNVLGRVPPGQSTEIYKLVGIDPTLANRFYDAKGDMTGWSEGERKRFMEGIVAVGALLALPDSATKAEWNAARSAYREMQTQVKAEFGEDIWNTIDGYYAIRDDRKAADAYLQAHPEVGDALDMRAGLVTNTPELSQYYGSLDIVERYYKGAMYAAIEHDLGISMKEVNALWDGYYAAKLTGTAKSFWNKHKELGKYLDLKDKYEPVIAGEIVRVGGLLQEPTYSALRDEAPAELRDALEAPGEPSPMDLEWQDFEGMMSEPLRNLVLDYVYQGDDLPAAAEGQLDTLAEQVGVSTPVLLQLITNSLR